MTRIPLVGLPSPLARIPKSLQFFSMATETQLNSSKTQPENPDKALENYPVPLSPPLPIISKDIELSRALTASSKSALFSLSRKDVIFEDEWLIAVNKPHGIYCESVLSAVRSLLNNDQGEKAKILELHLANRLDRDTSGVTIITKSHKVSAKLVKAFTDHAIKKTYIAFCVGKIPNWDKLTIISGHGRSKHGAWRVYGVSDVGRTLPGGSYVRDMETLFNVLSVDGQARDHGSGDNERKTVSVDEKSDIVFDEEKAEVLVRAYPKSGRTHQIRLHCQYLGIPIRGDVKYEGVYEWKGRRYDGHELHAESLCFEHPVTGLPLSIQAPLPIWASQALGRLSF